MWFLALMLLTNTASNFGGSLVIPSTQTSSHDCSFLTMAVICGCVDIAFSKRMRHLSLCVRYYFYDGYMSYWKSTSEIEARIWLPSRALVDGIRWFTNDCLAIISSMDIINVLLNNSKSFMIIEYRALRNLNRRWR